MLPRFAILAALALVLPVSSFAGATVEVDAPAGSPVYLDGERVGDAPLTLSGLEPGTHRIQIEDAGTGERRDYEVVSPKNLTVTKRIGAGTDGSAGPRFTVTPGVAGIAPVRPPAPPTTYSYVESAPPVVYTQPRTVYVAAPPVTYVSAPPVVYVPGPSYSYGWGSPYRYRPSYTSLSFRFGGGSRGGWGRGWGGRRGRCY